MTYVSTPALTGASRFAVTQSQAKLVDLQKELSSGTYADVGLQIGSHSGQFVSFTAETDNLTAITANNALTTTRLSATQTALTTLQTQASSFLASLTQASSGGNATAGIQNQASGNLDSLLATLNTTVGGQHVFAGVNTAVAPMAAYATGSPSKASVDAAFLGTFGFSQTSASASAVSGSALQSFLTGTFAPLFSGTNYAANWSSASSQTITSRITPDQSITTSVSANATAFQKLSQAYAMVGEFGGAPLNSDANKASITTAVGLVSSAITDIIGLQAGVGVAQSTVASANDSMSAQIDLLTGQAGILSQLSDSDQLSLQGEVLTLQQQIQASFAVTAKLQQMSLANYL